MGFYVNPPADGFQAILRDEIYIDKSELLLFTNRTLNSGRMLTCSSRPRRFGKSYAAKMLTAYYSRGADSRNLFCSLKIAGSPEYETFLNTQDLIYLDITSFISRSENIRDTVKNLRREVIAELDTEYPGCIRPQHELLADALMQIHACTGRKFYIVIDEWDALFREAKNDSELQKEYLLFLRSLFKSGQTPHTLTGAYMTGILPIKKYGTQSALTDFREYTMLRPGPLAEFIGFTEEEVRALCQAENLDFEEACRWYDGYRLEPAGHIYNPNSIVEAAINQSFGNYWTQTETYESLRIYIEMNFDGLKDAVLNMLGGQNCRIDTGTFQNDMTSIHCRDDVLTLLVHLGYLGYDAERREVFIPNEEIREEFLRALRTGKRRELVKAALLSEKLLDATIRMDEETVAELIQEAHLANTSPKYYNNEQALRSVVIMAYLSCIDDYIRFEEIAGGRGYIDILFLPVPSSTKPALLIELKWDRSSDAAISQIHELNYAQIRKQFRYEGEMLLVGISYDAKTAKHTCTIERIDSPVEILP